MPVKFIARDRTLTLSLSGEVDHHSVTGLMRELDQELDAVLPRMLTVDFSGVTFMDSSGIAILLRLRSWMDAQDGSLCVTGLRDQPARVMRASGIRHLFRIT